MSTRPKGGAGPAGVAGACRCVVVVGSRQAGRLLGDDDPPRKRTTAPMPQPLPKKPRPQEGG
jgi:hypothetical protein